MVRDEEKTWNEPVSESFRRSWIQRNNHQEHLHLSRFSTPEITFNQKQQLVQKGRILKDSEGSMTQEKSYWNHLPGTSVDFLSTQENIVQQASEVNNVSNAGDYAAKDEKEEDRSKTEMETSNAAFSTAWNRSIRSHSLYSSPKESTDPAVSFAFDGLFMPNTSGIMTPPTQHLNRIGTREELIRQSSESKESHELTETPTIIFKEFFSTRRVMDFEDTKKASDDSTSSSDPFEELSDENNIDTEIPEVGNYSLNSREYEPSDDEEGDSLALDEGVDEKWSNVNAPPISATPSQESSQLDPSYDDNADMHNDSTNSPNLVRWSLSALNVIDDLDEPEEGSYSGSLERDSSESGNSDIESTTDNETDDDDFSDENADRNRNFQRSTNGRHLEDNASQVSSQDGYYSSSDIESIDQAERSNVLQYHLGFTENEDCQEIKQIPQAQSIMELVCVCEQDQEDDRMAVTTSNYRSSHERWESMTDIARNGGRKNDKACSRDKAYRLTRTAGKGIGNENGRPKIVYCIDRSEFIDTSLSDTTSNSSGSEPSQLYAFRKALNIDFASPDGERKMKQEDFIGNVGWWGNHVDERVPSQGTENAPTGRPGDSLMAKLGSLIFSKSDNLQGTKSQAERKGKGAIDLLPEKVSIDYTEENEGIELPMEKSFALVAMDESATSYNNQSDIQTWDCMGQNLAKNMSVHSLKGQNISSIQSNSPNKDKATKISTRITCSQLPKVDAVPGHFGSRKRLVLNGKPAIPKDIKAASPTCHRNIAEIGDRSLRLGTELIDYEYHTESDSPRLNHMDSLDGRDFAEGITSIAEWQELLTKDFRSIEERSLTWPSNNEQQSIESQELDLYPSLKSTSVEMDHVIEVKKENLTSRKFSKVARAIASKSDRTQRFGANASPSSPSFFESENHDDDFGERTQYQNRKRNSDSPSSQRVNLVQDKMSKTGLDKKGVPHLHSKKRPSNTTPDVKVKNETAGENKDASCGDLIPCKADNEQERKAENDCKGNSAALELKQGRQDVLQSRDCIHIAYAQEVSSKGMHVLRGEKPKGYPMVPKAFDSGMADRFKQPLEFSRDDMEREIKIAGKMKCEPSSRARVQKFSTDLRCHDLTWSSRGPFADTFDFHGQAEIAQLDSSPSLDARRRDRSIGMASQTMESESSRNAQTNYNMPENLELAPASAGDSKTVSSKRVASFADWENESYDFSKTSGFGVLGTFGSWQHFKDGRS